MYNGYGYNGYMYNGFGAYNTPQQTYQPNNGQVFAHILSPTEIFDYTGAIREAYPPQTMAVSRWPFVGFRILMQDTQQGNDAKGRVEYLEYNTGFLRSKGMMLRETDATLMKDGYWLITKPVPNKHMNRVMEDLRTVLVQLRQMGIITTALVEVNISGKSNNPTDLMNQIQLPSRYMTCIVPPDNAFMMCKIQTINAPYHMIRTRYDLKRINSLDIIDDMVVIANMFFNIFIN